MITSKQNSRILTVFNLLAMLLCASVSEAKSPAQYIRDSELAAKVQNALAADTKLLKAQVKVEVEKGTVDLTGIVGTKIDEAEAVAVAKGVEGVVLVKDLLTVRIVEE